MQQAVVNSVAMPVVGLIVANDLHRHTLQSILTDAGYRLTILLNVDHLTRYLQREMPPDAWLIDVADIDIQPFIDLLAEHSDRPILVNDEVPSLEHLVEYDAWLKRLLAKLEVVAVARQEQEPVSAASGINRVERVWVLAASLGGPEAVKDFLSQLGNDLPCAFVYAQHIESRFDDVLTATLRRNPNYRSELIRGERLLEHGKISVVPVDHQLRFLPHGKVVETRRGWVGGYQPAIDQVIADLARIYRQRLGVIIFSGTCSDGEIGVRVAKACGATIWVQAPESCISDAMPTAALKTGCVSWQGTPVELARALTEQYAQ